ncbi:hypothetical protein DDZ14_08875 [Maritimibacter sp. 55A14]|nr:hypothetical protein DDZ14_08875 [Maritimibacter sp. 55A14]
MVFSLLFFLVASVCGVIVSVLLVQIVLSVLWACALRTRDTASTCFSFFGLGSEARKSSA